MLKTSARNCSVAFSRTVVSLIKEKSMVLLTAPVTTFLDALPNVNGAGISKADVLNHCSAVCGAFLLGSPTRFGRCDGPAPMFALSVGRTTVNGAPDWKEPRPVTLQPSAIFPPRRNGSSYEYEKTRRCR